MESADCMFCEIVAGRSPASVVYTDDVAMAFMTIGPVTPGHLLVIPKAHYPLVTDLPDDVAARLFLVAKRLTAALRASGLRCDGVNLFVADGDVAFQEVFHHHLHVFPRWDGDGFSLHATAWDRPAPTRDDLDATAAVIRAALAD